MANTKPLTDWLARVEARKLWERTIPTEVGGMTLTGYKINGQLAVAIVDQAGHGWELLVPAGGNTNDTATTLDGAATALGVDGCRGLVEDLPDNHK